ncbi:uroporphyrin-III C/tetrapyrrole methyltransferase [Mycoavidus cysteinexigens]|uniref:Ribosomal RNA small subunit methyltransferase I n=1 Tax=Mycoavidus cysteinexigens TaxID=1553431 RepID=A0A2Z6EY97_9BURK|nr:16S rRNA (cytidine(1402)-2'-O)-methyltransferase [Mycoavidus cysteinexigens]BBE10443.1 uroporphyrin-III C/tetrapyrrole methyltransferase [Mycoavidus cysteinexigens]GAM53181.1 rRNA small subunit methyltransferase I [bacterium endosymbiont of Mortierella elongata FMR23-6]GLR01805.1 ribosomal RNA small subunit methyltransferase I [Mycoavidus cysteinexigens]
MVDLLSLAQHQTYPASALYVVATPIGNAADITLRALHVLTQVDRVAAEDTRNSAQLLARYGIAKPLLAAHQHNEHEAAARIVTHLQAGERIAYISDAGTPGISDPGAKIVDAVRAAGFATIPIPGCNALAAALSVAGEGFSHEVANTQGGFTFIGFLPTKFKQRAVQLQALALHPHAMVFYEAPHRVLETVSALSTILGSQRQLLIARELTKLHENVHCATLAEGLIWLQADPNRQRGEFVLVVEGANPAQQSSASQHDELLQLLLTHMPVSAAARLAAALTHTSRAALYTRALDLQEKN